MKILPILAIENGGANSGCIDELKFYSPQVRGSVLDISFKYCTLNPVEFDSKSTT